MPGPAPDLAHECRLGHSADHPVCGVDEAGRGPLAGPVVAAAVILPPHLPDWVGQLNDSKQLTAARRAALYDLILQSGMPVGVGQADVAEIDRINILQATFLAMARAVTALPQRPALALVDGNRPPVLDVPVVTLVRGDALSLSIAAASIVAKVTRDRLMQGLALQYPGYGWEKNAGYGTAAHLTAIKQLGVTPVHRRTFTPISQQLALSV
jgi:ribonuclease HII